MKPFYSSMPGLDNSLRLTLLVFSMISALAQPSNDFFDQRSHIEGNSFHDVVRSDGAGNEQRHGEIQFWGSSDRTLWWSWEAPADGEVTMDTEGSEVDTMLAVWVDTIGEGSLELLTGVSFNDNRVPSSDAAEVRFQARKGTRYEIQVGARSNGLVSLNLSLGESEVPGAVVGGDSFRRSALLEGLSALGIANNRRFTNQHSEGEAQYWGSGEKTMWWHWTAPETGLVEIRTQRSEVDTLIAVWVDPLGIGDLRFLEMVGMNDDAMPPEKWAEMEFQAAKGVRYLVQVVSLGRGDVRLALELRPNDLPGGVVAGDDFVRRAVLSGHEAIGVANARFFGNQQRQGESQVFGSGDRTLWWAWLAPEDTRVSLDSFGSDLGAERVSISVFEGSSLPELSLVASGKKEAGDLSANVAFSAKRGQQYQVRLVAVSNRNMMLRLRTDSVDRAQSVEIRPAMELFLNTRKDTVYVLEGSEDLKTWFPLETNIRGTGQPLRRFQSARESVMNFFRLRSVQ